MSRDDIVPLLDWKENLADYMKDKSKKPAIITCFSVCCYILLSYIAKRDKSAIYVKEKAEKCGKSFYERQLKRMMDKSLSFVGLMVLAPVYGLIALAIMIDDPGPVLFTQKRVGKNKEFFMLHKFRSMKMSTPHDIPTHQLKDPEQYITKVGKILRKTSLDELPQLWDIFRGKMSIIGPRPALWNQDDLVAGRDKYGANDILPGLTGFAQINGRDELEIAEKAKLDGEYAKKLKQGGMKALFFDAKCFFGTIFSVLRRDGVVEGGTGELHRVKEKAAVYKSRKISRVQPNRECVASERIEKVSAEDAGFEDYGYLKHFEIDTGASNKKRVLITGEGSYIGESFERWAKERYPANFTIDTIDMQKADWRGKDFSGYDAVFHVAGIAHADVGKVSEEEKKKYYAVNTDLAIETAKKAKEEGVRQFVLMSSMIIYGDSAPYGKEKVIDENTLPRPSNFYGDSKWQADKGVRKLADENFRVAVLRPPMIYGKGSKGNYPVLVKLAKKLPVFPDVENRRSMLYIDNLCEFLCKLMLSGEGGVYFPQNGEYTKTSEMVRMISDAAERKPEPAGMRNPAVRTMAEKKIRLTKLLNLAVMIGSHTHGKISGLVNKAFGNSVYSRRLSEYRGLEYQIINLKKSVVCTENMKLLEATKNLCPMNPVLILVNHDVVIYNFRLELVERLLKEGYEVHISSPTGEHTQELISLGAHFHEISIERHGMDPKADLQVLREYRSLIRSIRPIVVLTYTVKPNVYGGIAAKMEDVPYIANVTGLGMIVNRGGLKERFVLFLYRLGLQGAQKVFFQNESNKDFMLDRHVISGSCPYKVLPGSGVNLSVHSFEPYPEETDELIFTTVGRIMRDKGTDELLFAAEKIKENYPDVIFRLIGFFDDDYEEKVKAAQEKGIIEYISQQRDIHPWISKSHAVVHPSHHEGMSNVLLEAAATGRPVLASDIPGCRETFEEGVSGLGFVPKDGRDLVRVIEAFIHLPYEQKRSMGSAGREKMEREFGRDIVIDEYMKEIDKQKFY